MTNTNATLAALDAFKPAIAEQYARLVRGTFGRISERFGPTLRGVSSDWTYARAYRSLVSAHVSTDRASGVVTLDEVKLSNGAARYADAVVIEWAGKIVEKIGALDEAEVRSLDGARFEIVGTVAGRRVRIEQSMIVNVSPKGTPFNQFPARIYVDGKHTSAAAYKKLFPL